MWLRRVLSRVAWDGSDSTRPIPASIKFSLQKGSIPFQTWFPPVFHTNCHTSWRWLKRQGGWSNPGQSNQLDATTWTEKPDKGGHTVHCIRRDPKKSTYFGAIFNLSDLVSDIASCGCMFYFELTCPFPPNCGLMLTRGVITGRWRFYFINKWQSSETRWQFLNISVDDKVMNRWSCFSLTWFQRHQRMKYFSWQLLLSPTSISSAGLNEFWYIWLSLFCM